jgi:hypothetical protein
MIKNNEFNFCPNCGTNKIKYLQNKKWFCSECGFDLYNNVASALLGQQVKSGAGRQRPDLNEVLCTRRVPCSLRFHCPSVNLFKFTSTSMTREI